ncbi:MAG: sulfotransferase [Pseudomonadota bacterium]
MTDARRNPVSTPTTSRAKEAQALLEGGHLDEARELLSRHLRESPEDGDALYTLAVSHRLQAAHERAEQTLHQLLLLEPDNGRALQELGHLARDQGEYDDAINRYAQALRSNPALLAAYRNRIALLQKSGRLTEARQTQAQLDITAGLPKALLAATDLLAQGRVLKAERLCRSFLREHPHHTEAMRLLAEVGVRLGALEEAQFLLESACELDPENKRLRIELIRVLGKRQRFADSLAQAELLLAGDPDNLQYQSLRAIEQLQLGDFAAALASFDAIIERVPDDPVTLTSRGHALKTCGRSREAIDAYRRAAEVRHHGEAWYALANLKTYTFSDAQLEQMLADAEKPSYSPMDRVYLAFALGKAFEDRGDYSSAFDHFARGNALRARQLSYSAEQLQGEMKSQLSILDAELFEAAVHGGSEAPDPIFILGMPRAGSTLLEQILASHSLIEGTRELPNILSLAQKLRRRRGVSGERPGYPKILRSLSSGDRRSLGESYLEQAAVHRHGAPRFIDKMPNNFRHIGLIHLILPHARIIDARREPMACCFSNFQQLFAEGQEFSYDLTDLGHYYRCYEGVMAHWDTVLPERVFRVQHERLLDDLEGELHRLFEYLDLPFEDICLRYWESDRAVRTPSSEQVRRPLFHDAQYRWQNYADWLGPLREALGKDPLRSV